jgi:hypothetical protein
VDDELLDQIFSGLPPMLTRSEAAAVLRCRDANRDPDQVGLAIEDLLIDHETGKQRKGFRDPQTVLRAILHELGHRIT